MKKVALIIFLVINTYAMRIAQHDDNYMVYGVSDKRYPTIVSGNENKNKEIEFQISFKAQYDISDVKDEVTINAAYTQTSFWQIHANGSPFRDTNYKPELFLEYKKTHDKDEGYYIRITPFAHISNGQTNTTMSNQSYLNLNPHNNEEVSRFKTRSWTYTSTTLGITYKEWEASLEVWETIIRTKNQNPDIKKYLGLGELSLKYKNEYFKVTSRTRYSFGHNKGAQTLILEIPYDKKISFYSKIFTGYGESLIDYNRSHTKYSTGFAVNF